MKQLQKKFERFKVWLKRPRTKKRMYALLVLIVALWVIGRFIAIGIEKRMVVFNPSRAAAESGLVVEAMTVEKKTDILKEPITVKNNRAMVSGARVSVLRAGQKIGNGEIVSVSRGIDLDTGLHAVRTRNVADGLNYAETRVNGYFVPSYAVIGDTVFVARDGVAHARTVHVARSDADTSVITDGLNDGDVIILSHVSDGEKIQIKK